MTCPSLVDHLKKFNKDVYFPQCPKKFRFIKISASTVAFLVLKFLLLIFNIPELIAIISKYLI